MPLVPYLCHTTTNRTMDPVLTTLPETPEQWAAAVISCILSVLVGWLRGRKGRRPERE